LIPVYNNLTEDIIDLVEKAELQGRTLKYLVLSKEEYEILCGENKLVFKKEAYDTDCVIGQLFGLNIVSTSYHLAKRKEAMKHEI